jgi:two-component system invasion response regulator UvrY
MASKILIADDHSMLRQGLRTMLEQAGHTVDAEAKDGESACALWEKCHPDMAMLDIDMPGIGGLEALKRILKKMLMQKF